MAMLMPSSGTAFELSFHPNSPKYAEPVLEFYTSGRVFWGYESLPRCETTV